MTDCFSQPLLFIQPALNIGFAKVHLASVQYAINTSYVRISLSRNLVSGDDRTSGRAKEKRAGSGNEKGGRAVFFPPDPVRFSFARPLFISIFPTDREQGMPIFADLRENNQQLVILQ